MSVDSDLSEAPILTQKSSRQKPPKLILPIANDDATERNLTEQNLSDRSNRDPLSRNPDDRRTYPAIFAFSPNRDTLGGTAYLICETVNILVDCPAWDEANRDFLQTQGGVQWLFLTHRGAIGKAREIQQALGCAIVIQEQEAYLLPSLTVTTFQHELTLTAATRALWTPGHSPGSACLYHSSFGGILFSGRHLLPTPQGQLRPVQSSTTFHWRRQLQSVQQLHSTFTPETLHYICPGANIGFLRGKAVVETGYEQLNRTAE
jgi:glyoxylase-like metal-dependent hydrolase (beta-lactamase superfamily II)